MKTIRYLNKDPAGRLFKVDANDSRRGLRKPGRFSGIMILFPAIIRSTKGTVEEKEMPLRKELNTMKKMPRTKFFHRISVYSCSFKYSLNITPLCPLTLNPLPVSLLFLLPSGEKVRMRGREQGELI